MAKRQLTPRDGPVLAIDPGREQSALVRIDDSDIDAALLPNADALLGLHGRNGEEVVVIERMNFMPNHCGDEIHETNVWAGRFLQMAESHGIIVHRIYRRTVAVHITGLTKGDATVRAAIIDRYGGKDKAIGGVRCKKCNGKGWRGRDHDYCQPCFGRGWTHPPGPLKKVVTHCWQALALGLAYLDGVELADD